MANKEASDCQTSSKYTISCEEYSSTELVTGDVVRSQKLYVPAEVCCTRQTQRRPGVKSGCWAGLWDFGTTLRKVWGKFDISLEKFWNNFGTTVRQTRRVCWTHQTQRRTSVKSGCYAGQILIRNSWEDIMAWCWNLKLVIRLGSQHMIRQKESESERPRGKLGCFAGKLYICRCW